MAKQISSQKPYAHIEHPLYEGAWIVLILVSLGPFTLYHVLLHLLSAAAQVLSGNKSHSKLTFLRRLTIVLPRYVTTHLSYGQTQFLLGPPLRVVRLWGLIHGAKWHAIELNEQDASDQLARLVFLGAPPTKNEKVIVYIPGGGYVNPITPNMLSFWLWVQSQLDVRVCILLYRKSFFLIGGPY
ncbi:hypothetical protein CPB85DRAFT_186469 [Mucidula mucida]|nr:hypothetical protein CPB85DRAFT_186469 [Mucidula mucida]